jgi:hypothetical protein
MLMAVNSQGEHRMFHYFTTPARFSHNAKKKTDTIVGIRVTEMFVDFSIDWYRNFNPHFPLSLSLTILSLSNETQHCQLSAVNINLNSF